MSIDFWSLSCVMLVMSLILAAASMVLKYIGSSQERYSGHAEARVVDIVMEPRSDSYSFSQFHNSQTAVFEFIAEGKLVKVKDPNEVYPTPYHLNQKIRILYNPKNPQQFCVAQWNRWSIAAKAASTAAVVCVAAACVFFLMHAARVEI